MAEGDKVLKTIKKLYIKLIIMNIFDFENAHQTVAEQNEFMNSLTDASDDYERAYNHYILQMYFYYNWITRMILNIASFFLLPFMTIQFIWRGRRFKENQLVNLYGAIVCETPTIKSADIIPPDLKDKYQDVKSVEIKHEYFIDKPAKDIFLKCYKRYIFHPYFLLFNLRRISEACTMIHIYHPKALVVFARERDFAIPLVTLYCEKIGSEYVSFMHGDYIYSVDKAFLRFSTYYAWDDHYVKMLSDLKWPRNQFRIYVPKKLQGITQPRKNKKYDYYITYYFGAESHGRIRGVKKAFDIFSRFGYKCKIRPHPRFSDLKYLHQEFCDYEIEDTKSVPLNKSFENTLYISALNSTVLSQAYYSGKEIVIDDYSDVNRYNLLLERRYIMLNKPHKLLSELVNEAKERKLV